MRSRDEPSGAAAELPSIVKHGGAKHQKRKLRKMEVSLERLRAVADALFSHLETNGVTSLTISEDYYWEVPAVARYDRYEEPREHTVGQLSDDVAELDRMIDGERPMVGYGLVWLAAILRRLGESAKC